MHNIASGWSGGARPSAYQIGMMAEQQVKSKRQTHTGKICMLNSQMTMPFQCWSKAGDDMENDAAESEQAVTLSLCLYNTARPAPALSLSLAVGTGGLLIGRLACSPWRFEG